MSTWTHERASVAANTQAGKHAEADAARQRLKALKAEEYINRLVAESPPLTNAQRDRLALLLRGGRPEGGRAA